ncbi:MAG: MltA domain-containing protein [Elusimicrobiales bacterium]
MKTLAAAIFCLCFAGACALAEPPAVLSRNFSSIPPQILEVPIPPEPDAIKPQCPRLPPGDRAYPDNASQPLRGVSPVSPSEMPDFADDMERAGFLSAVRANLEYWREKPDSFSIKLGGKTYGAPLLRRSAARLIELFSSGKTLDEIRKTVGAEFTAYKSVADDGSNHITITGYYEADIPVAASSDSAHTHALYLRPPDLVRESPAPGFDYGMKKPDGSLAKYHSREQIENGALAGKGLEFAWSAHPAEIMLLQIQGSGFARFPDGSALRLGFDGANGWPYKSVQRILMDCGEIPAMSFADFIKYMTSMDNGRETRIINLNPRYIFFRVMPAGEEPHGAIDRPLTAGRSVAIDPEVIPLGLAGMISSTRPVADDSGKITSFRQFSRFIATQDTGSAIRGPGRLDLFWGSGKKAAAEASGMKASGDLYLFVLKK